MFWIEPLEEKHVESLHSAFDAIAQEGLYFAETEAGSLEAFRQWINTAIRLNCPQFVAMTEDGVIGWSMANKAEQAFVRHSCTLFIGVLAEWRGYGIGKQLLEHTLYQAWENNLTRVQLDVYADNHKAIQLYHQFGFEQEGLQRCAHIVNGQYRDIMTMALLLPLKSECEPLEEAEAVAA